jgi:hypothetical protein
MKRCSKNKQVILFGVMFLILSYSLGTGLSQEDSSAELNFNGEWYSKGFSSVSFWKTFINQFVSTLFNFRVIEDNEKIQFGIEDEEGNEQIFDSPVKYNNNTGELSYSTNINILGMEIKEISYNITLNGEKDLRKIIHLEDYFGKTIGEIVNELMSEKVKIGLVGVRSNITLTANKNFSLEHPIIDVNYLKNIKENFTSMIIEESSEETGTNQTGNLDDSNRSTNTSLNLQKDKQIEYQIQTNSISYELEIINPKPFLKNISMFVNETKTFSIENPKNDSIKWYLNEKLMKKDTKSYSFNGLKKGDYVLSVKIKEGLKSQGYIWNIKVIDSETTKNISSFWIWIFGGSLFIMFWIGIIYYLKRQMQDKNSQIVPSVQNN